MTIKELKEHLEKFSDKTEVAFRVWESDGPVYYRPHFPLGKPMIVKADKVSYGVIGIADRCLADMVTPEDK